MALEPGVRLGSYEVVAPLGAGGMGEVYRARDTRLDRTVAIKVLPTALSSDPERRRRFEQEAHALSALNHPHICTLYDIGSESGTDFLVMEYVDGETLAACLARGPLPANIAVALAIQVADALQVAHQQGIVHRDLKPGNIMLTQVGAPSQDAPQAKLLDFGLAKLAAHREGSGRADWTSLPTRPGPLTERGTILGTLEYMAPEQLEGKDADAHSDLWALGVILYEMLTGRRAFDGPSQARIAVGILTQDPPPVSAVVPLTPPALEDLVRKCLAKAPGDRWDSARDVAEELRGIARDLEAGVQTATQRVAPTPVAAAPAIGRRRRFWRTVGAAAAVVAVAASLVAALWPRLRPAPGPGAATPQVSTLDPRIVVTPFVNATGDASLAPFGAMVADWITQGLTQIREIETVPIMGSPVSPGPRSFDTPTPGEDPVRAIARATGAGTVVTGTYYAEGDRLRVHASIVDARTGTLLAALGPVMVRRGDSAGLEPLRQAVMGAIAVRFAPASMKDLVSPESGALKPPLYEAYQEYVAGLQVFVTDPAEAIRHFQRAAAIDPGFFRAQFQMSGAYNNIGDDASADRVIAVLYEKREQWSPVEQMFLDWARAWRQGRWEEALRELRELEDALPRHPEVRYLIGSEALRANRPAVTLEAIGKLDYPKWLGRGGEWWFNRVAQAHHLLANYEEELRVAVLARQRYPDVPRPRAYEIRALAALGRLDEVNRLADDALTLADAAPGDVMAEGVEELRAHGHRSEALALAARAVEWHRARAPQGKAARAQIALGEALYRAERWQEARDVFAALTAKEPGDLESLGYRGVLAARLGNGQEARRISAVLSSVDRPHLFGSHTYWRARIAALLGEQDGAVALFRQAFAEGCPFDIRFHRDMDFESLRDFPPYQALLRPKDSGDGDSTASPRPSSR